MYLDLLLGEVAQLSNSRPNELVELDIELDGANPIFVRIHEPPPSSPNFRPHPQLLSFRPPSTRRRISVRTSCLRRLNIEHTRLSCYSTRIRAFEFELFKELPYWAGRKRLRPNRLLDKNYFAENILDGFLTIFSRPQLSQVNTLASGILAYCAYPSEQCPQL